MDMFNLLLSYGPSIDGYDSKSHMHPLEFAMHLRSKDPQNPALIKAIGRLSEITLKRQDQDLRNATLAGLSLGSSEAGF
jgi:hypothetical protein